MDENQRQTAAAAATVAAAAATAVPPTPRGETGLQQVTKSFLPQQHPQQREHQLFQMPGGLFFPTICCYHLDHKLFGCCFN